MFFRVDGIGGKIKGMAMILMILEIVISMILGCAVMIGGAVDMNTAAMVFGFIMLLFGLLFSWVSFWLMYGFGELIENSERIAEAAENKEQE